MPRLTSWPPPSAPRADEGRRRNQRHAAPAALMPLTVGTAARGPLWWGTIGAGDELRAEPFGLDVRVRSVQVHDRPVERAEAGQRVAVSLPGIERGRLERGDALVAPGAYPVSYRLDVVLEALDEIPARVHVHHGTADVLARVARVGERWAQLRLAAPVVAARGDHVVLRAGSSR